jgi:ectoine hydroxylase-related dioxygenase (phytanoyl-CoA dioxygenase family)
VASPQANELSCRPGEATLTARELERVVYEIDALGFSVVHDVIGPDLLLRLKDAVSAANEEDHRRYGGRPGKQYEIVANLVLHGGAFLEMLDNAIMHQVFAPILSPHCILYTYGAVTLLPGVESGLMSPHVDAPRLIRGYHAGLTMTLAIDDFTDENGATLYLPGSQELEKPPSLETFDRYAVSVARSAGSAIFFNPRCFHRARRNTTDDIRRAISLFAVRPFMKQRFDFPRMMPAEAMGGLSRKARQFLGFDARVPTSMDEFYVAPEQRLYKANQG